MVLFARINILKWLLPNSLTAFHFLLCLVTTIQQCQLFKMYLNMLHSHSFWPYCLMFPVRWIEQLFTQQNFNSSVRFPLSCHFSKIHYLKEWAIPSPYVLFPSFFALSLPHLLIGTFLQHLLPFVIFCCLPWMFVFTTRLWPWRILVSYLFMTHTI